ncbi:MAG: tetratricopeptide repeat protein [Xanthobacteraceae bacterium]
MRISDLSRVGVLLAVALAGPAPLLALDAKQAPAAAPTTAAATPTPFQAFRSGTELLKSGDKDKALAELRYAAEQGHPLAQWKLGRMYAEGDGVKRDDVRAFQYFSRIASDHAEASPWTQQARFVSNAYVSLGFYYLNGIPNSPVVADADRAHGLFSYAASYFGDADAQYQLARLYLEGVGAPKDVRQGARWLGLAAQKGQYQAQALLGRMLFRGEGVPKQRARGLMWLTLGRDAAAGPDDGWIVQAYEDAFGRATEAERSAAYADLQSWMKTQR